MIGFCQAAIGILLAVQLFRLYRQGSWGVLFRAVALVGALALAFVVFSGLSYLLPTGLPVGRLATLTALLVFLPVRRWLLLELGRLHDTRPAPRRSVRVALGAGLALGWTASCGVGIVFLQELKTAGIPAAAQTLEQQAPAPDTRSTPSGPVLRVARPAEPAPTWRLGDRLLGGLDTAYDGLADVTGARSTAKDLAAIQAIFALPPRQRAELATVCPEVLDLVEHPRLLAVIQDRRLMELIQRAAEGSPVAWCQLAADETIHQLLVDPDIRRVAARLDLQAMHRQIEAGKR